MVCLLRCFCLAARFASFGWASLCDQTDHPGSQSAACLPAQMGLCIWEGWSIVLMARKL